jgi:hypothetical protein
MKLINEKITRFQWCQKWKWSQLKSSNKEYKKFSTTNDLILPSYIKEALIGLLLGDAHLEKLGPNRNARIQIIGGLVNKPYIVHLYDLLKAFVKRHVMKVKVEV